MRGKATKIILSNTYPIRSEVEMIRENLFFYCPASIAIYIDTMKYIGLADSHNVQK